MFKMEIDNYYVSLMYFICVDKYSKWYGGFFLL